MAAPYRYPAPCDHTPLILLVPGTQLEPRHWMHRWAGWSEHCRIVELGLWDEPNRNTWVNKLNLAIRRADRPVVVVTDDIAALALAWWVEFESIGAAGAIGGGEDSPVIGAIAVNPPNVDLPGADPRLDRFGACPRQRLPFTTFLVGDVDSPVTCQRALMRLAADWGAAPVSEDTRGPFKEGWLLLESILGAAPSGPVTPDWTQDETLAMRETLRQWSGF